MLEMVPDIAQSTHGIRNIFADIRNVPTRPHMVLGMFLLAFSVLPITLPAIVMEDNSAVITITNEDRAVLIVMPRNANIS
jgi:hypothetical protein